MMKLLIQILNFAVVALQLASCVATGATNCVDLRAIDQTPQPVYLVSCNEGDVEITQGEFHSIAGQQGNFAHFCTSGPESPNARGELRWHTTSGFPEVCDVFTPDPKSSVRGAAIVYFVHHDLEEQEIDVKVHSLVWQGNDLIKFDPPVPGITVE